MPKTFAASRGASSFCTVRLLRIRRIQHYEPYYQYVSIRMRRESVTRENGTLIPQRFTGFQRMRDTLQTGKPDRKSTRLNSSHVRISYAVFCLKKKTTTSMHITDNSLNCEFVTHEH